MYNHGLLRHRRSLLKMLFKVKYILVFHAALVPSRNTAFLWSQGRAFLFKAGKAEIYIKKTFCLIRESLVEEHGNVMLAACFADRCTLARCWAARGF